MAGGQAGLAPWTNSLFCACTDRALARGGIQESHPWLGEWGRGWKKGLTPEWSDSDLLTETEAGAQGTHELCRGPDASSSLSLGAEPYTGDQPGGWRSGSGEDKALLQPRAPGNSTVSWPGRLSVRMLAAQYSNLQAQVASPHLIPGDTAQVSSLLPHFSTWRGHCWVFWVPDRHQIHGTWIITFENTERTPDITTFELSLKFPKLH